MLTLDVVESSEYSSDISLCLGMQLDFPAYFIAVGSISYGSHLELKIISQVVLANGVCIEAGVSTVLHSNLFSTFSV